MCQAKKEKEKGLCKALPYMTITAVAISILEEKRDCICFGFHGKRVIYNLAYIFNHDAQRVT